MISQEAGITNMMRSCKNPPSMLELCEIFKNKRQLSCGPSYRKILAHSSAVDTTVEERGKAIEVGTDEPSGSRKTQRSTRTSLPREKEDLLDDTTVERRRDLRFSHPEKVTEVSESEDNETFSEEEYYPDSLQGNNLTRAALKQSHTLFMNRQNHGLADREMSPQQRDEERLYTNQMTQGRRRRDIRRYLHYEAACSSSQANAPDYSHCKLQNRSERKASQPYFQDVFGQRRQSMGSPQRSLKQTAHQQPPVQRFTRNVAAVPCQLNSKAEEQRKRPVLLVHRRCDRQEADCEENSHNRRRRVGICQRTDETREHRTFVRVLRKRF